MSTDHKDEAEKLLHFEDQTSDASLARDAVRVALVHATMYAAEQQRIANLQEQRSYLQRELEKEFGYGGDHPKLLQLMRVDGLIREGLGL